MSDMSSSTSWLCRQSSPSSSRSSPKHRQGHDFFQSSDISSVQPSNELRILRSKSRAKANHDMTAEQTYRPHTTTTNPSVSRIRFPASLTALVTCACSMSSLKVRPSGCSSHYRVPDRWRHSESISSTCSYEPRAIPAAARTLY